jgi:hypothetical protein
MTADRYLGYWQSNLDWWEYDKKGRAVVKDDAPQEAKDSYKYYLERTHNRKLRL